MRPNTQKERTYSPKSMTIVVQPGQEVTILVADSSGKIPGRPGQWVAGFSPSGDSASASRSSDSASPQRPSDRAMRRSK